MNSRGRGLVWRRATVAVVLGLVGAGSAGCGINRNAYADVPQLEVAWSVASDVSSRGIGKYAVTDDAWITYNPDTGLLTALGLADGSTLWQVPSGIPCEFSAVNEAGLMAIRTRTSETDPKCERVSLIDAKAGEERWSVTVGDDDSRASFQGEGSIGLSEETVIAPGSCGVERWAVASGKAVAPIAGTEKYDDLPGHCLDVATSNGLALIADPKAISGYDADTGRKLWSRPASNPEIDALYETEPLLAQVKVDGVAGLRTIAADTGEVGPLIGRPSGERGAIERSSVEVVGERVVGSYASNFNTGLGGVDGTYRSALRAWDLASGEEQSSWPGKPGEQYLGVDETGVYLGREVRGGGSGNDHAFWITRSDWSGKSARTVGWAAEDLDGAVKVGDLLIESGRGERPDGSFGERTVAYRIPRETTADPIPGAQYAGTLKWEKGDVRPDPTVDPCAEVGEETLRDLGFAAMLDRPAPLDCTWAEGQTRLTTFVDVSSPDSRGSALENAERAVQQARDWMESSVAVEGLGDEAWAFVSTHVAKGPDKDHQLGEPGMTTTEIHVAVRQKNIVAYVTLIERGDTREGSLPPAAVIREASLVTVLEEVLEAAGGELSVPTVASDEPITQLPDICDAGAADVRNILPGAKPTDLSAKGEKRLRGCAWATRRDGYVDSHVQVVAYAVGASPLTGASGAEAAEAVFADSRGQLAMSRGDKNWDESAMAELSDSYSDASHFVARSDNVILVVDISLRDRDKPVAPTIAPRIADHVMNAIRR